MRFYILIYDELPQSDGLLDQNLFLIVQDNLWTVS